jgi:hypothetical protein
LNFEIGREVPPYFQFVFGSTERKIAYQPETAPNLQHMAPMDNRIG